jgi:DNA-binding MarR family transcriptional regulator
MPRSNPHPSSEHVADRLHSAAIHLLRRLRTRDAASGLGGAALSALSVIVHAGPIAIGELARAEQVRAPTISRLVRELEEAGLVRRHAVADDARIQRIDATAAGKRVLDEGRRRRVETLSAAIAALDADDQDALRAALEVLERLAQP